MSEHVARVEPPRSVIIKPSKWPWTIIAIALSLSFVSGAFIAIDSSQSSIVKAKANSVPVDFIGTSTSSEALDNPGYIGQIAKWILHGPDNLRDIEACEVITQAFVRDMNGTYPPYYAGGLYPIMFLPSDSQEFLASYRIVGDIPDQGGIALPKQMAEDMNVSVGDTVSLYFGASEPVFDPIINNTVWHHEEVSYPLTVSQIWTQDGLKDQDVFLPDGGSQQYLNLDPRSVLIREFLNPAVLNIDDLYPIIDSFGSVLRNKYVAEESQTLYFIWIDREDYIDYEDTTASIHHLDALYGPLSSRCLSFDVTLMRSELVFAIHVPPLGGASGYRLYYLGLSLPVLALGIYVTAVGAGISTDLRDDDIQSVKARGIGRRAIIKRLTKESVVVGLAAGIIGYLLGILVSRIMLTSIVTSIGWYDDVNVTSTDLAFTWFTLLVTLGLGVLIVVLASFFAAVKATKPPRTAPSELEALHLLPIVEVILIGLSLISIIGILMGTQWIGSHGFDSYVGSLDAILNSLTFILFPAMPFMLTVGIVGLLTRWPISVQRRLTKSFSRDAGMAAIPLGPMAARCDKRARRMSIMVALVLVLVIFVSVSMDTIISTQKESVRLDIGSEVKVPAWYIGGWWHGTSWYPDSSFPTEANFSGISGISHLALYQNFVATTLEDPYAFVVAIDPESYLETVPTYARDANGDPAEVLSLLDTATNALVTENYASENDLKRGDALTMQMTGYVVGSNESVLFKLNVNIAHVVHDLPGLGDIVVGYSAVSSIPKYTFDHISEAGGVFIDAEEDADQESIASQAMQVFTSSGYYSEYSQMLDREMEVIDTSPDLGGLFSFLTAEVWIAASVVLVGVAMSSYATARFAVTASSRSGIAGEKLGAVKAVLASESASLAIVGASVGVFVGLITSYLFGMMWKPYDFPRATIGAEYTAMVFVTAAVLVVGIVVLATLSSVAGSNKGPLKPSDGLEGPSDPRKPT
jgi:hypothetical protein